MSAFTQYYQEMVEEGESLDTPFFYYDFGSNMFEIFTFAWNEI